jgi:hypothetical protein
MRVGSGRSACETARVYCTGYPCIVWHRRSLSGLSASRWMVHGLSACMEAAEVDAGRHLQSKAASTWSRGACSPLPRCCCRQTVLVRARCALELAVVAKTATSGGSESAALSPPVTWALVYCCASLAKMRLDLTSCAQRQSNQDKPEPFDCPHLRASAEARVLPQHTAAYI